MARVQVELCRFVQREKVCVISNARQAMNFIGVQLSATV